MDESVASLIEANAAYLRPTEDGKVECILNGHTMPANAAQVQAFLNGKKFRKAKASKQVEVMVEANCQFLSPSLNFPDMIFCALTNFLVARRPESVTQHLQGKRFKRAQERFQEGKQELFEEPPLDDMEEEQVDDDALDAVACLPEAVLSADGSAEAMDADAQPSASSSDAEAAEQPGPHAGRKSKGKKPGERRKAVLTDSTAANGNAGEKRQGKQKAERGKRKAKAATTHKGGRSGKKTRADA